MKLFSIHLFIVVSLSTITPPAFAQAPDTLWTRTYGGSDGEIGTSVRETSDGGFVIVGQIDYATDQANDAWMVRTNASGDTLWTRTFGGPELDAANAVRQTSDGGYVIAGHTGSFGAGSWDAWLIRTDANGDTIRTKTFGGTSSDQAFDVQQTSDGGFVLAGNTRSFAVGGTDAWLIRTEANGDTLWTRTYGGPGSETAASISETSDGGFIITGSFFSIATGASDLWLIRTDAGGDTLWTRAYNGPFYPYSLDSGYAARQTSDGGFIVTGVTAGRPGTISSDVWLLRTDADGDTLWTRTFGGPSTDRAYDVQQLSDGGFVLAGFLTLSGSIDALLIGTNANGDSLWSVILGADGNDQFYAVQQTSNGGLVVTGFTSSYGNGSNDFWLIRLGSDASTSVKNAGFSPPGDFSILKNYPNPFNPSTTITYSVAEAGEVTLSIFNAAGRVVRTFQHARQNAGEHSVVWDGKDQSGQSVASGVYFYQVSRRGLRASKPMLLLK